MSVLWLAGHAGAALVRLSQVDDAPPPSEIKPDWVALVLVLALCAVTVLLWLSMRKQLGKINFEEKDTPRRRRRSEPPVE